MKKLFFFLLLNILLISFFVFAEIYISEIMYNPEGDDNNREYIEVYSNVSLENYTIEDLASHDILALIKQSSSSFALIVEEGFDANNTNATIYSVGATIGNNLNNEHDVIVLRNSQGKLVDALSYSRESGGDNNGYSLCKHSVGDAQLYECSPTPGTIFSQNDISYPLFINEIFPDPFGNDSAFMPGGEWVELFNDGETDVDLEEFLLEDDFGRRIFISNSQVLGDLIIKKKDFFVVYMNGKEGFLNNDGFERISLFDPQGILLDQISYSNSREDVSWARVDDVWLSSQPTPHEENPENEQEIKTMSEIEIRTISLGQDNVAKWGDALRVTLEIYKGDTTKEAVELWMAKGDDVVSKRTSLNIQRKFTQEKITLPVQIHPNCKEKFDDGSYELRVEGLDTEARERVEIRGVMATLCEQQRSDETEKVRYEILDIPSSQEVHDEFVITVKIINPFDVKKEFSLWSEILDGKTVLSEKIEEQKISVPKDSSTVVQLKNRLKQEKEGHFVLKTYFLEKGRKRPETFTHSFDVSKGVIQTSSVDDETLFESNLNEESTSVFYESKGGKQKRWAWYFFVLLIALMAVYGVIRHD